MRCSAASPRRWRNHRRGTTDQAAFQAGEVALRQRLFDAVGPGDAGRARPLRHLVHEQLMRIVHQRRPPALRQRRGRGQRVQIMRMHHVAALIRGRGQQTAAAAPAPEIGRMTGRATPAGRGLPGGRRRGHRGQPGRGVPAQGRDVGRPDGADHRHTAAGGGQGFGLAAHPVIVQQIAGDQHQDVGHGCRSRLMRSPRRLTER